MATDNQQPTTSVAAPPLPFKLPGTPESRAEITRVIQAVQLGSLGLSDIERSYVQGQALLALDKLITAEHVETWLALANTKLGFRTDRDPARPGKGGAVAPYPAEIVKRCCIEGLFLGARQVGNEMNIIGGNCYLTKEYFERKVGEFPGLTDLRLAPQVPEIRAGNALVGYTATYKLAGQPAHFESVLRQTQHGPADERIVVRVNDGMGMDALLGKAKRKFLALLYQRLTGSESVLPEGDVDDPVIDATFRPAHPAPQPGPGGPVQADSFRPAANDPAPALNRFAALRPSVTRGKLEAYLGAKASAWTPGDVEMLLFIAEEIKAGHFTWQAIESREIDPWGVPGSPALGESGAPVDSSEASSQRSFA